MSVKIHPFRPVTSTSYEGVFERAWRLVARWMRVLEKERSEAPGLLAQLLSHTSEQREILLRNSRRFRTWGLLELVVEQTLEISRQDASRGEEWGKLALRIADFLDAGRYGAERLEDLRARTLAYTGNALRIQSDLQGADKTFRQAMLHLRRGTGDLLEMAILLDLLASLRRSQRRFPESFGLLRRAVAAFLKLGDLHRAGRSLVSLSTALLYAGRPEESVPVLYRALDLIDPNQEPRLLVGARHNLILVLAETGRFLEAQRAYRDARPLYRSFPEPSLQNRRKWVKGKISRGLGQTAAAESLFLAARDGFLMEGIPYETALVSMDLALLYAEQSRTAELKRLAAEIVPIFSSRQIHREALAALAFLQQAVDAEQAGLAVVERVAKYLRKARYAPDLAFDESL
jgi:tetratricopeptide (TPR) repeat protein